MKERIYVNLKYAKKESGKGYILDISTTGVGIAFSSMIKKNTIVDMLFNETDFLALRGRVVYVGKRGSKIYNYKLGIRFVALNAQQKDFLKKFLSQYLHKRKAHRLNLM